MTTHDHTAPHAPTGAFRRGSRAGAATHKTLATMFRAGDPYAVVFGGQGAPWLGPLAELTSDGGFAPALAELTAAAEMVLNPVQDELVVVRPAGFDPLAWAAAEDGPGAEVEASLFTAAVSIPGVFLGQLAALKLLQLEGLDPFEHRPAALAGHSQGVLGVESVGAAGANDVTLLALAQLIGAAATLVGRRRGLRSTGTHSAMLSFTGAPPAQIQEIAATVAEGPDAPVVSIRNGARRVVVSGRPEQLDRLRRRCEQVTQAQTAERKAHQRGGAIFAPAIDPIPAEVAFHHPAMAEAVDIVVEWAQRCDIDTDLARRLGNALLVDFVDWSQAVDDIAATGVKWVLDLGPGDLLTRLTTHGLRGRGVAVVAAATRGGHRNLFTPGAVPALPTPWTEFAPKLVELPDGTAVVETAFTRLTGRSPIVLAGMTPTTVDGAVVAAAANAGFWAELAGGGQVTKEIFEGRVEQLKELLEPGRAVQFNAMFLDPYLWKLHIGGRRLVQRARQAGAPIDGVTITAGIPELDEAIAILDDLDEAGVSYVAFKPGTVAQIRSVVRIAAEVPAKKIIVQIEGGRAGGHHSWEDLDDLLIETYSELRARPNVVIAVGGGIGTPERAAEYLTGQWSAAYGYPKMPVDSILVGTAAMAVLEATTSPQVKQLLVDTTGTEGWIGAGKAAGGMASGRSQLGADIHEIDNAASRCGRLLDEVAGDAKAVAARRDEIVAALGTTAKPYFGDAGAMTYRQWLDRYVELAVGEVPAGAPVWVDVTWKDRFASMLRRAEARLHPDDRGLVDSVFGADGDTYFERPHAAVEALAHAYPAADTTLLHPADVPFFLMLCRTPGKPVNFVPVVDQDVRRWWRSDSLWQAHDPRYPADAVSVIPGTVAVAGITRVDEPVADLLTRFEQATIAQLGQARPVPGRRRAQADGALALVLAAPDLAWGTRLTRNPVWRLGAPRTWQVSGDTATHPDTGARLRALDAHHVELQCPLRSGAIRLLITVPAACATGAAPVVSAPEADAAMLGMLAIAAGGPELPPVVGGVATLGTTFYPEQVGDHAGVTAATLGADLAPRPVPDVLVGACWPAVFATIGSAKTAGGQSVVEGLLDLVHLDHHATLLAALPAQETALGVTATLAGVTDSDIGRVVEVRVAIDTVDGSARAPLATLVERFAIRGRSGPAVLPDPVAPSAEVPTPRRRRAAATITAPSDMRAFARVSGDHNPIHTSDSAARLAGLPGPIVHGMWLSAAAQHVAAAARNVSADSSSPLRTGRAITAWTTRFLGMVRPGATIDVTVDRVGVTAGAEVLEVSCRAGGTLVMSATAQVAAPRTAYALPGQGIQSKGMGMDARGRSKAARDVWDRADAHTRTALGFSVLAVVRDNPVELTARGVTYRHPDGVLYLTQFTQVAMATLAMAQVAELRESGMFVEDALYAGHSVGEYNALAAVAQVLPLEAVLEMVFRRGSVMHTLVPRDAQGRSDYRLAAIRPSQAGVADDEVTSYVEGIAARTGEFLQVVNLNLRGSQYAVAGTVKGLKALEKDIDAKREARGGRRCFILVPGIDVPFHSRVLFGGVPDFRAKLEELVPREIDPSILVGRYIPNLVPRLFTLDREFIAEIAGLVDAPALDAVLADYEGALADPAKLARTILIELLAWQFASPVRWIETQDLLFSDTAAGGLAVERFVEIGVGTAPTIANLAAATLKLPGLFPAAPQVLNLERDAAVVRGTDTDPVVEEDASDAADAAVAAGGAGAPAAPAAAAPAAAAPAPAADSGPRPADLPFPASAATKVLVSLWTKLRPDQVTGVDTIESLCDGVSSRRNQLLLDLGSELGLGAIDGAAEAEMPKLAATVDKLARTYKPFGPVLSDAVGDQVRKVFGPSGKRPAAIGERVRTVWQLGPGWEQHVTAEVALGTRDGASVRGGELGSLLDGPVSDGAAVDKVIDAAVASVGARHGATVAKPASGAGSGGTVDAAALGEFTQQITGPDGVLASAARLVLDQLGLADAPTAAAVTDTALADLVTAELGSDWARQVAPAFDAKQAVLFDDRWASAREDLARLWAGADGACGTFEGAGEHVATQALWWQQKARDLGRPALAETYGRFAAAARSTTPGAFAVDVAVVTGASKGSIAAAVTAGLLEGGATVVATTSSLDGKRLAFYRELYRRHARAGAALWVVPANMASFSDLDALVNWVGGQQTVNLGGKPSVVKEALRPTLLFPFAAPRVGGDMTDAGPRSELQTRVLLWSVEKLIAGLSAIGKDHHVDGTMHVVLPGSPNRGLFGGDGAYGETKAALDAVVGRWNAERGWGARTSIVHAIIGWVRGTGLMGGNDPLVEAVEKAGVRTWSTEEMAAQLLEFSSKAARKDAVAAPVHLDLTGGLAEAKLDLPALAKAHGAEAEAPTKDEVSTEGKVAALPPAPTAPKARRIPWPAVKADLSDMVVIVGAGELGPYGSSRTRFEYEVSEKLSAAGVLELAWVTGLITWHQDPKPGWYDAESGDLVPEEDIADRYHDTVVERCGIRRYEDDGPMKNNTAPLLSSVFLDKDLTFVVSSEAEARAFVDADPANTTAASLPDSSDWKVTRKAGTEIRVPRKVQMTRTVGGQIPTGFDPTRWGIPADMAASLDRVAAWNLVATVDAFLGSGFTPSELLRWVHPILVANTQGVGIGGMNSMRSLYVDALLGESRPNDILQEALPNVIAAHVMQSYVGGYGDMVHPVAACATAAVSVAEGVDKIKLGRAQFVVAGGFDDLGVEGITGFGDMNATANTADMLAKGIDPKRFSRANDRRRGGFVESQGGGTILLARGDLAAEMGLPVLGVVAWAGSFADGVHTSIPAPGIGALGAGRGGRESQLAKALAEFGLGADDIAVLSKHDTSTNANDPNESELHERLAGALGRSDGAPLFVVSQKTLTGHSKGGAAAFQLIGLCQVLASGVIPPNRSLDCVDDVLAEHPHLVWLRQTLDVSGRLALRAGLVTSLGFGHVSALVAVLHPEAFYSAMGHTEQRVYLRKSQARAVEGQRRLAAAMIGGEALYQRPADRRLGAHGVREREAAVLLDSGARLCDGTYTVTGCE